MLKMIRKISYRIYISLNNLKLVLPNLLILMRASILIISESFKRPKYQLFKIHSLPDQIKSQPYEGSSPIRLYMDIAVKTLFEQFCTDKNANILEVGCGRGAYSQELIKIPVSGKYTGIDLNHNPEWNLFRGKKKNLHIEFAPISIKEINELGNTFNFSFSLATLHYLENDVDDLKSILASMDKNSFSIHCIPSLWSHFLYIRQGVRRYSAKSATNTFTKAGFEVVDVKKLCGVFSFLLHITWITLLESNLKLNFMRKNPQLLRIYSWMLTICLKLDKWSPWMEAGYIVIAKTP